MSKTTVLRGNILYSNIIGPSLTPTAFSTTTQEQTFSVADLKTTDSVQASFQGTQTTGVFIANTRVSAPNTLAITFGNLTGSSVTPAAGIYYAQMDRLEDTTAPTSAV